MHRESLNRVLRENPHALAPVLEALLEVIDPERGKQPIVNAPHFHEPAPGHAAVVFAAH